MGEVEGSVGSYHTPNINHESSIQANGGVTSPMSLLNKGYDIAHRSRLLPGSVHWN